MPDNKIHDKNFWFYFNRNVNGIIQISGTVTGETGMKAVFLFLNILSCNNFFQV